MEKEGVIRADKTPPEKPRPGEKQAAVDLEAHTTKRLQDAAEKKDERVKE